MDKLLRLIESNARLTLEEIAAIVGESTDTVGRRIDDYKREGVILGTRTLINWEKVGTDKVHAMIEVRVAPRKDIGFDDVAETIAQLSEVDGVQLMSGGHDLTVFVSGTSYHEVAMFVARRLALMDGVLSTATHFVLYTYKQDGVLFSSQSRDERQVGV